MKGTMGRYVDLLRPGLDEARTHVGRLKEQLAAAEATERRLVAAMRALDDDAQQRPRQPRGRQTRGRPADWYLDRTESLIADAGADGMTVGEVQRELARIRGSKVASATAYRTLSALRAQRRVRLAGRRGRANVYKAMQRVQAV